MAQQGQPKPRHQRQFLHDFRFHAEAILQGSNPLQDEDVERPTAGFQSITAPNYKVGTAEYRDGLRLHTVKQPGTPEVDTVTFERGITKAHSAFLQWMYRYFTGDAFYADIRIFHWGHDNQPPQAVKGLGNKRNPDKARVYVLRNAFPTSVTPAGDLDADSEDISIAELEVEFEYFDAYTEGTKSGAKITAP